MENLKIEIDNEQADEITLCTLKNAYDTFLNELEDALDDSKESKGIMSFDPVEEIFRIVQICKSLEVVLSYFGETKDLTSSMLKQHNAKLYYEIQEKQNLQKTYENLISEYKTLEDAHIALVDKVKNILKG